MRPLDPYFLVSSSRIRTAHDNLLVSGQRQLTPMRRIFPFLPGASNQSRGASRRKNPSSLLPPEALPGLPRHPQAATPADLHFCYYPIGQWTGRLILPNDRRKNDSVDLELHNAPPPYHSLVGKVVRLQWSQAPQVQADLQLLRQDVTFTRATLQSQRRGNVHPQRLNGWKQVGRLESLAGGREQDDVVVMLQPRNILKGNPPVLVIDGDPVQITGRQVGLVTILELESPESDRFWVRHFNRESRQFDGPLEVIRLPEPPAPSAKIRPFTHRFIPRSPLNPEGWYIYGDRDPAGVFVVQALEPRALMRLHPNELRLGKQAAQKYLSRENWHNTEEQKGNGKTVLVAQAESAPLAMADWQEGDRALVIHLYGGIGGRRGEPAPLGIVSGHFSYGVAQIRRDPLSGELRFDIEYRQIYGHNPDGIIAGAIKWFSYMGNFHRGWLGTRPISDVVVKLDAITQPYQFGEVRLSPLREFTHQLAMMAARYRIGDGTGGAIVTPARSCVQDSNQALFVTIKRIEAMVETNPQIQLWLDRHPNHPQTLRFQQLVALGQSLERILVPLGFVRSDWETWMEQSRLSPGKSSLPMTVVKALTTWRTMLPRRAHDEIAKQLLRHGASLWFIRTNQIGGFEPDIHPTAPTGILGRWSR